MNKRRLRTGLACGPSALWVCLLLCGIGLVSSGLARADSLGASPPLPPLYVASFNRACSPDTALVSAAFRILRRLGDQPEALPGSWVGGECCGLSDCAQKLQTRYGSIVGGQLERTASGPQAQIWILQPHKGRVLLAQHTCADCDQPERIARMVAGLAEQIPSLQAAWVPLASLPPCPRPGEASRGGSASPRLPGDARAGSAGRKQGALLSVLLSIRGSGANLPTAKALRGGLLKQLLQSGYTPSRLSVPQRIEDPRELLRGDRVGIPVVDVDVRSEAKDRKNPRQQAIESVTLRLFHPAVALQTSLDCSLQDCSGRPLVAMSRSATGYLLDQLALRRSASVPGPTPDPIPACLPAAQPAPDTAIPAPPLPPSPPPASPKLPSIPDASPPLSVGNPAEGAVPPQVLPPPPPAQKRVMPWSVRLGIAGLATGLAVIGVGALIGAIEHGKPLDRTCYCNQDAWTLGHWMIGIGAGVAVAGGISWLSGVRMQAKPDPANLPSEETP